MLSYCGVALYGGTHTEGDVTKAFLQNLLAKVTASVDAMGIVTANLHANIGITIDPTTVSEETRLANITSIQSKTALYNANDYALFLLGELGYAA